MDTAVEELTERCDCWKDCRENCRIEIESYRLSARSEMRKTALMLFVTLLLSQLGAAAELCASTATVAPACVCKVPGSCCKSASCSQQAPVDDPSAIALKGKPPVFGLPPFIKIPLPAPCGLPPAPLLKARPPRIRTPDISTETLRAPPVSA